MCRLDYGNFKVMDFVLVGVVVGFGVIGGCGLGE